jgi:hypothetical protein
MEITEEHLQRVFDEIEEHSIKSGKKGAELATIVYATWSMRTRLLAILRAKSEEDLILGKMIGKHLVEMLEKYNGDISSHDYTCGHCIMPEIIYKVADSVETFKEWRNDVEGLCIECWGKKKMDNINKNPRSHHEIIDAILREVEKSS